MTRIPGLQSREILERQRELVRKLLLQDLTTRQIIAQVGCNTTLVTRVRREMEQEGKRIEAES